MIHLRYALAFLILAIFSMGVVVIFSTSSAEVLDFELEKSTHQGLYKQLAFGIAGMVVAYGTWKMGYRNFVRLSPYVGFAFILILILTLVPGIGREVNGSRRWIGIFGFYFQPSEFVKYLVPAYAIYYFLKAGSPAPTLRGFLWVAGISLVPITLILIEPNNGTAAVIGISLVVIFYIFRVPIKYWAFPLIFFTVVGATFASQLPYVTGRINVYLHPELDIRGRGHQPYQAKIAAGTGGLFGRGPGKSLQKLSYLPEAQNDYIAAIYAEEYGFLGIASLITAFMLFILLGYRIASQAIDEEGYYLGTVVTFLIGFQAFLNLGVVSGLLPSTGLNLPFFSQGGTSLMANLMGIALLMSIAAETERAARKIESKSL